MATATVSTSNKIMRGVGRGGSPRSWGNSKIFKEYCTLPIQITLEQRKYLLDIGKGNLSAGFRLTVDNLKMGDITSDDIVSIDRNTIKLQVQTFVVSLDKSVNNKIRDIRQQLRTQTYMFYHAAIRRHQENN